MGQGKTQIVKASTKSGASNAVRSELRSPCDKKTGAAEIVDLPDTGGVVTININLRSAEKAEKHQ